MKFSTFIFVSAVIVSCTSKTETNHSTTSVNVDSLTATFLAGWNNKDSAAILNTIAQEAIVMNDSLIHRGHAAIANNWVSGGVKVLSNIQTSSVINGADERIAYDGGTYTLDLTPPGGPLLKEKGNYSLVWAKQLSLIHI